MSADSQALGQGNEDEQTTVRAPGVPRRDSFRPAEVYCNFPYGPKSCKVCLRCGIVAALPLDSFHCGKVLAFLGQSV